MAGDDEAAIAFVRRILDGPGWRRVGRVPREPGKRGRDGLANQARDFLVSRAVREVVYRYGFRIRRNPATRHHSACSIVSEALARVDYGLSEAAIFSIWFKGPGDEPSAILAACREQAGRTGGHPPDEQAVWQPWHAESCDYRAPRYQFWLLSRIEKLGLGFQCGAPCARWNCSTRPACTHVHIEAPS